MDFTLSIRELTLLSMLVRTGLAILLGGLIGIEREMKNRAAGFRTYMLVCLGSCIVMMTNQYTYQVYNMGDPVRMGAQVISGIGFLGAGTIIVTSKSQIKGLTTAAGLWASACLGLAIGIGFYEVAIFGAICILLVMSLFHSWESLLRRNSKVFLVYIELEPRKRLRDFVVASAQRGIQVSSLQLEEHLEPESGICFVATVRNKNKDKKDAFLKKLREIPSVQHMEEL